MKSGMTERNVVPASLPAEINNLEDQKQADDQQKKGQEEDAESNWSDQLREANEKSGYVRPKKMNTGNLN